MTFSDFFDSLAIWVVGDLAGTVTMFIVGWCYGPLFGRVGAANGVSTA
jgi:hypothetical protein